MQENWTCLGKVKRDLSCLGELEGKKERIFFCFVFVFYKHQSSKTKPTEKYIVSHNSPGLLIFMSVRTPKTYLVFWVMVLIVKLPWILLFLTYLLTLTGYPSQGN
jgi:hypothetical protein